jgi:hypothetical protein
MAELMLETEPLIKTWEDKIGSRRAYKRDVATDNDEGE